MHPRRGSICPLPGGPESDVIPAGALTRRPLDVVQRIVVVLEISAVEDHHQREQALVGRGADKRILQPRPRPVRLQPQIVRTEARAAQLLALRLVNRDPALDEVRRHLTADRPDDARRHDLGLRFRPILTFHLRPDASRTL